MLAHKKTNTAIKPTLKLVVANSLSKPGTTTKPTRHPITEDLDDIDKVAVLSNN